MNQFFSNWLQSLGLMELNDFTIVVRLLLSAIAGGLLGLERMRKLRAASLRTYMMVCIGACIAMVTGESVVIHFGSGDPGRIAAQVISGIGFIGAGTIMMTGYNRIKGLTTAAGLWANAAMGLAIGAGLYVPSFFMVLILLAAMMLGEKFQLAFMERNSRVRLYMILENEQNLITMLRFIRDQKIHIVEFESNSIIGDCKGFSITLTLPSWMTHKQALSLLGSSGATVFIEEI